MNPDLDTLIRLQSIESERDAAQRTIEGMPARRQALEARLAQHTAAVAETRQRVAENQAARRAVEKELATVQGRLSKYKDQLMEVKTNREYQAMQVEIATAQGEVRRLEDQLLERMLEADELAVVVKGADTALTELQAETAQALAALEEEERRLTRSLQDSAVRRSTVAAALSPPLLAQFDSIRAHRNVAVVEARDGHCTVCHVRLRPQVFNQIRRNEEIIRCDSCGRILYFVPPPRQGSVTPAAS